MNVLSLFDGISCGQIALERCGIDYENYFASEIDKYAIQATQKNYPSTIQLGDITNLKTSDLPKIDIVFGGSPCQSFSNLGNGKGFDGKSGLFWEFVRVLNELKEKNPDILFLLENVKMKKEWQNIISDALDVKPIEINSRLVSAQNRPRLYWTNIPNITQPKDKKLKLKDVLEKKVDNKFYLSEAAVTRITGSKFGREFATIDTEKTRTLTAGYYKIPSDGAYFSEGERKRKYTPKEFERLQTLPEDYTKGLSNSQRYKTIGNGWTVDVISHIFSHISVKETV